MNKHNWNRGHSWSKSVNHHQQNGSLAIHLTDFGTFHLACWVNLKLLIIADKLPKYTSMSSADTFQNWASDLPQETKIASSSYYRYIIVYRPVSCYGFIFCPLPLSNTRNLRLACVLHLQPDRHAVWQRLLFASVRLSPPGVPSVQQHQAPSFRGHQFLARPRCASILQWPLPTGVPSPAQPWNRPRLRPAPPLRLRLPRRLPADDAAGRQPVRTPSSPAAQRPLQGSRGGSSAESTPETGWRGRKCHRESDAIQRVRAWLSEDAVLLPLQRADADTALHWPVCQHYEGVFGEYLTVLYLSHYICALTTTLAT